MSYHETVKEACNVIRDIVKTTAAENPITFTSLCYQIRVKYGFGDNFVKKNILALEEQDLVELTFLDGMPQSIKWKK